MKWGYNVFFCNNGTRNILFCATLVIVHVIIKLGCAIIQVVVPGLTMKAQMLGDL
jgi:hypothetical protein